MVEGCVRDRVASLVFRNSDAMTVVGLLEFAPGEEAKAVVP